MILSRSGDQLLVVNASAVTVDVVVDYMDYVGGQASQPTPGCDVTGITGAVTIVVLEHPGGSCARVVTSVNIHNKHATDSSVVTLSLYDSTNAIDYVLDSKTLLAGESLTWSEDLGFTHVPAYNGSKLDLMRYVTADSVHALAHTAAVITGLTPFPVLSGHRYAFEAQFFHVANATTSGAEFFVGGVTATYIILGSQSVVTAGVATTTMCSGVVTAVDTAVILQTTSSTAATVPSYVAGLIIPSADGDVSFKASSEVAVAAGLTVKKGSWAWVRECDN